MPKRTLLPILREEMEKGAYTGVIHCFTASADFRADCARSRPLYQPLRHRDLQECRPTCRRAAKDIPADRLLVETDSPFLAPVPHRGKPCEPAFVADTARFVAELRGESLEDLAHQTTNNFFALFSKCVAPGGSLKQ